MQTYRSLFGNIHTWAFRTTLCNFIIYLVTFLILCYAFSQINQSCDAKNVFICDFEKYLTLAAALFSLLPFLLSLVLTFGILHKSSKILWYWIIGSIGVSVIYVSGLVASGIYLSVEGSKYVGYIAITLSLIFGAFSIHSILLVYYLKEKLEGTSKVSRQENISENSFSIETGA